MGKRYHCDYCDKTMVATPSMLRTHNKGIAHQKLVQEHYQQYKDPETILAEETAKKPCSRFAKGECQFGSICRYTHYSAEQLNALRKYVAEKNQPTVYTSHLSFEDLYQKLQSEKSLKHLNSDGNTVLYDSNGLTHVFPWVYNPILDNYGENLPPSIKRIRIEDFVEASATEWG